MIWEEFALLRFGQHSFGQFHVWEGIVLKSDRSQREMMVLGSRRVSCLEQVELS